jgi:hypothetical protein
VGSGTRPVQTQLLKKKKKIVKILYVYSTMALKYFYRLM